MDSITLCRLACSDMNIRSEFGGVFACDELPKKRDNYSCFIVNLDPKTKPGKMIVSSSIAKKRKFNIDISKEKDGETVKLLAPYSVYIGKGVCLEVKDFRKTLYLGFVKSNEENEVKNRFNLHVDQIPVLLEGLEHIQQHLKSM
ncbi:uncharacterized protein TNCV_4914451 [Trichonephila clavipes]|nr:uncharacterized protein TNCV_4914451 [Trichonephila clavipes]